MEKSFEETTFSTTEDLNSNSGLFLIRRRYSKNLKTYLCSISYANGRNNSGKDEFREVPG
jgi:hypothetical protein